MKNNNFVNSSTILIICDSLLLTTSLIDKLVGSGLRIIVITKSKNILSKNYISNNRIFIEENIEKITKNFVKIDYLIYFKKNDEKDYVNDRAFLNSLRKETHRYKIISERFKPKAAFLLYGLRHNYISEKNINKYKRYSKIIKSLGALILYGDLISLNRETYFLSDLYHILIKSISGKRVNINIDNIYYPLLDDELSCHLMQLLFSLGAYGKTTFIAGRPLRIRSLFDIINKGALITTNKISRRIILPYDEKIVSKRQSKRIVKEVHDHLKDCLLKNNSRFLLKNLKVKISIIKLKNYLLRGLKSILLYHKIKLLVVLLLFLFLLPLLLMTSSLGLLYISKTFFEKDYFRASSLSAKTSYIITENNYKYLYSLKGTIFIGEYFELFTKPSAILKLQSESAVRGLEIVDTFSEILGDIFLKKDFDSENITKKIIFDLDILYQQLGFLESEISGANDIGTEITSLILKDIDLASIRKKTLLLKSLTGKLPIIFDADKLKKYAFVFQNNSNLRPTGGGLESFLTFNFSGSKVVLDNIKDVSWADKYLSGKVEPPATLKKYFNVNSWYFKDSNWEPDFPSSAQQMESFLDKELDISLEGLIALDKEFIYKFLGILDKGYTKEYLDRFFVKEGNLENYPKVSEEFPFTVLLKSVFAGQPKLNDRKITKITKEIYSGLNNRNIQVFIKNNEIQKDLLGLNWDGSLIKNECSDSCISDFISLNESTRDGDGSAVIREAQLSVYFQEGVIKRKLAFYIENQNKNTYKAYLRLFSNADVGYSPISLIYANEDVVLDPEIRSAKGLKEAGVFIEIEPEQTLIVIFSWEGPSFHNFSKKGEYELLWKKQAGVNRYPVEASLFLPENLSVFTKPTFTLTDGGVFRYNTSLDRDLTLSVFW